MKKKLLDVGYLTDQWKGILDEVDELSVIQLWNLYSENNDDVYYNRIYFNNAVFFDKFFKGMVNSVVRAIYFGNYNYADKFVKFSWCGNLESYNNLNDVLNKKELAKWLANNSHVVNIKEYNLN